MKIKFKEQGFQLEAVKAVVDCFAGQKIKTNKFTLQRSADLIKRAKQETQNAIQSSFSEDLFEDIGYRNSPLGKMSYDFFGERNFVALICHKSRASVNQG